jgi:putative oxidoreductase
VSSSLRAALLENRLRGGPRVAVTVLRVLAGLTFVATSLEKFLAREETAAMFATYGLPGSPLLVSLVGTLELVGGLMLVLGALTRLVALALAGNMAGAILTAGLAVGGPIHLGLAPALLVVMVLLLWTGPGAAALDNRLAAGTGEAQRVRVR